MAESGERKWFGGPDFDYWIRPEPRRGLVRQNADNAVSDAIEGYASAKDVRIAVQTITPKIVRNHCDVCAFFFLRQKCATENRTYSKNIKIIRGNFAAVELDRITYSTQGEECSIFGGDAIATNTNLAAVTREILVSERP